MRRAKNVGRAFTAIVIWVMTAATGLILSVGPLGAAGDPIVVIVNSSNPVNNLSMGELRKLFLSDRAKWDTGRPVSPVMRAAGAPERTQFLRVVCGMDDADFDRYFLLAAFAGKFPTPSKVVDSARDVRRIVGNSPGAIGFVRSSDFYMDRDSGSVIKTVTIDGLAGTDAAYKIRM
jgi:ABC-type phosphate transport system substrate-binding protein